MDDTININGVEYIRKDCISNILKSAQNEIESLFKSYDDFNGIKKTESRLVDSNTTTILKPKPKRKRRKYRKGSDPFEPNDFAKKKYNILKVMDDWTFKIHGSNKNSDFDIRDVIKIKRELEKNISMDEAKLIAKDLGISYSVFMKVSYNVKIGTFDKYINDYVKSLEANKPLKKKKITIQNNPEKRRELGLS